MGKKSFIDFRFLSSIYLKFNEKRLNFSNSKIHKLQEQIEIENSLLEYNKKRFDELSIENTLIKKNYADILKLFENVNKTISIKNDNYDITIWENVIIKKENSSYVIQTKREQVIYVFNEKMNDFIDYFLTLHHSIIVLSVDNDNIVLHIRLQ